MILGKESRGAFAKSTMKFNSVTESRFPPLVDAVRFAARGVTKEEGTEAETFPFDAFPVATSKFKNYARRSIRPGEKIHQVIFQPEIRKPFFHLSGTNLSRQVTPEHLTILTDGELIFIRDSNLPHRTGELPYGGIWRYIPLSRIESTSYIELENIIVSFQRNLVGRGRLESLYDVPQREQIARLQKGIRGG